MLHLYQNKGMSNNYYTFYDTMEVETSGNILNHITHH